MMRGYWAVVPARNLLGPPRDLDTPTSGKSTWNRAAARKPAFRRGLTPEDKARIQRRAFHRLNYDGKLEYCARPEEIDGPGEKAWVAINAHLGVSASCTVRTDRSVQ